MGMKLPVELNHVHHKHGGRITRITKFTHEEAKPKEGRSRDVWFFVGDVEWSKWDAEKQQYVSAGKSTDLEIAPHSICFEDEKDRAEVDQLIALMNEYLLKHGEWCDSDTKHEGWYAHRKATA